MNERETLSRSWDGNAAPWVETVRGGGIASRRLATDAAMVNAILERRPRTVLDLGCGEGWLARALTAHGIRVVGTDGSAALIDAASRLGGGHFLHVDYAALAADPMIVGKLAQGGFDLIAANFALLDDQAAPLLTSLARILAPGGSLAIQTLHPDTVPSPQNDGWRVESFEGFGGAAPWQPMPWYHRSRKSWLRLPQACGLAVDQVLEPCHPETGKPLSLLILASTN